MRSVLILTLPPEREVYRHTDDRAYSRVGGQRLRVRGARAQIRWTGPHTIEEAARERRRGGVYVVARGERPIYVGEARDFGSRWSGRKAVLRNLNVRQYPFRVWLGTITALRGASRAPRTTLREDVEHVLIRFLREKRGYALTNATSNKMLVAAPNGIEIRNYGSVPKGLPKGKDDPITVAGGGTLELPWY